MNDGWHLAISVVCNSRATIVDRNNRTAVLSVLPTDNHIVLLSKKYSQLLPTGWINCPVGGKRRRGWGILPPWTSTSVCCAWECNVCVYAVSIDFHCIRPLRYAVIRSAGCSTWRLLSRSFFFALFFIHISFLVRSSPTCQLVSTWLACQLMACGFWTGLRRPFVFVSISEQRLITVGETGRTRNRKQ